MTASLPTVPSLLFNGLKAVRDMLADPEQTGNLDSGLLINMAFALGELEQKCRDKSLSIGVIGEVNSGKSTFINAFSGRRILREDILEDMARVPTSLSFSEKVSTSLIFADGREEKLTDLKFIGHAVQNFSEKPMFIHYRAPFPDLPADMILWELPAIDSINIEVTHIAHELAKSCDILFVTTPAHKPLSMGLLREVRRFCAGMEKDCVVLATSADLLNNDELNKMEIFFSRRLQKEFGREIPYYFISALSAIDDKFSGKSRFNKDDFLSFRASLLKLVDAQKEKLVFLNCGRQAINHMEKFLEYAQSEREKLVMKLEMMNDTPGRNRREYNIEHREGMEKEIQLFQNFIHLLTCNMRDVCLCEITRQRSEKDLAQFINAELPSYLDIFIEDFVKSVERKFKEYLSRLEKVAWCYQNENKQEELYAEKIKIILLSGGELEQISHLLRKVQKSMGEDENIKIGGGTCAGFLLGALVPGIGWLGAGLAALTGTFLGASLTNGLKEKKNYYKEIINYYFERLFKRLVTDYACLFQNAVTQIQKDIEARLLEQKSTIEDIEVMQKRRMATELCLLDRNILFFKELCEKLHMACE